MPQGGILFAAHAGETARFKDVNLTVESHDILIKNVSAAILDAGRAKVAEPSNFYNDLAPGRRPQVAPSLKK
jgi:hypothetical protein